jgi:hypothetical protein
MRWRFRGTGQETGFSSTLTGVAPEGLTFCPFCAATVTVRWGGGDKEGQSCYDCGALWTLPLPEHSPLHLLSMPGQMARFRLARIEAEMAQRAAAHAATAERLAKEAEALRAEIPAEGQEDTP